jgi:acid phosphatase
MSATRRDFVRTLFAATAQMALSGPLLTRGLFAAETSSLGLNFIVVGDWGRKGQKDQLDVARQMGLAASQIMAPFIVSVGDNFYDFGVSSADDPQFKASFEDVYTASSLQVPWRLILGNHDYRGNCQAQIDYCQKSPRWSMPSRYYQRTEQVPGGSDVDMIYIDTNPFVAKYAHDKLMGKEILSQDCGKQLAWIEQQLAASKAPWKIVFGHHPIYSGGEHGDTPELVDQLLPLLSKYGVQAYICGHDHDLQHLQAGGVNMFCVGAGSTVRPVGATPQSKYSMSHPGFMAASLKPEAMDVRLIAGTGEVLYSFTVPQKIS